MNNSDFEKNKKSLPHSRLAFYESLDAEIKKKGFTRNGFAKETGITIDSYMDCQRAKEPGLDTVVKIADYFGLSIDEMCGRTAFASNKNNISMREAVSEFIYLVEVFGMYDFETHYETIDDTTLRVLSLKIPYGPLNRILEKYLVLHQSFQNLVSEGIWTESKMLQESSAFIKAELDKLRNEPASTPYYDNSSSYDETFGRKSIL